MFATLGVRVIIVEKRPRLLEFGDCEVVEALSYHMRDRRATMRLNEEVESVEELPDGRVAANLVSKKRIVGDALLYAVGRQGNIERLNLAAAGIETDDRGRIKVDADYRTSQKHIFAVGDVIGFPSLASVSMEQGRLAEGRLKLLFHRQTLDLLGVHNFWRGCGGIAAHRASRPAAEGQDHLFHPDGV
jgi:NAD(P) transhydrogenase